VRSGVSKVLGFRNGAIGLISGDIRELSLENASEHLNISGINILGRTETPIRTNAELQACARSCRKLRLDCLIVVGGVGTHADTALLAERLPARVIGIPASIENDIPLVEKSIGHDTACRVIAGIVGCLGTLAASSKRQWCFVRIAGRSLSHIIGEVARLTHPNLVILNEEIVGWSLADIVSLISDLISERAKNGFDFGIVVFPECVLDDLEEVRRLVDDFKTWGAHNNNNISGLSKVLLEVLPDKTRVEGTRLVEPELLLQALVGKELQRRRMFEGSGGSAFRSSVHVISHQARSALPSDFDCDLGFQMGLVAGKLARDKDRTGLLVTVSAEGCFGAVPLTSLLTCKFDKTTLECSLEIEQRKIDLNSVFHALPCPSMRRFMNPGPLQMGRKRQPAIRSVDVSGQLKKIEKVTALCSLLMSVDSGRREVIKSGLEHTLALLRAGREDSGSSNGEKPVERRRAGDWLRPLTRSHSRVVKIVPIT
jgi:pyrophosphate--fructose-6-phosphate 1-phosphotransferase